MTTITVWLLIAISDGGYNKGTLSVVARFADSAQCAGVQKAIRQLDPGENVKTRCIQAVVLKEQQ